MGHTSSPIGHVLRLVCCVPNHYTHMYISFLCLYILAYQLCRTREANFLFHRLLSWLIQARPLCLLPQRLSHLLSSWWRSRPRSLRSSRRARQRRHLRRLCLRRHLRRLCSQLLRSCRRRHGCAHHRHRHRHLRRSRLGSVGSRRCSQRRRRLCTSSWLQRIGLWPQLSWLWHGQAISTSWFRPLSSRKSASQKPCPSPRMLSRQSWHSQPRRRRRTFSLPPQQLACLCLGLRQQRTTLCLCLRLHRRLSRRPSRLASWSARVHCKAMLSLPRWSAIAPLFASLRRSKWACRSRLVPSARLRH
jgi:hypothetical protein